MGLLICLSLAGCQVAPPPLSGVQVGLASHEEQAAILAEGRLVPRSFVNLTLADGARPAEVNVIEGQRVSAGDVLLRVDGYEQAAAELAYAELELVSDRQELEALYQDSAHELAKVEMALAEATRERTLAEDHLEGLLRPRPQLQIGQAHANLILAENQLAKAHQDLEKAEKKFANKKSFIWRFINQRQFKLRITSLEAEVAYRERRYQDAQEKYDDLLAPPDPIDVALAEASLAQAESSLHKLERQRQDLLIGPDVDNLEFAEARLSAAESRLDAARVALESYQLAAPIDGVVVELNVKPGEWMPAGRPVAVLADFDHWIVETVDLHETLVPGLLPGQPVRLHIDAIPGLSLNGRVENIDLLYTEDDDEIYYTVDIETTQNDPRLRWGMTVQVEIGLPKASS